MPRRPIADFSVYQSLAAEILDHTRSLAVTPHLLFGFAGFVHTVFVQQSARDPQAVYVRYQ
jgi:hypothetical protein